MGRATEGTAFVTVDLTDVATGVEAAAGGGVTGLAAIIGSTLAG